MAEKNRQWILRSRLHGMVDRANFEWQEGPVPTIRDGQFLVRNLWLSCGPTQRPWMEFDTHVSAVPIGEVMHSVSAGRRGVETPWLHARRTGCWCMGMAGLRGDRRRRVGAGRKDPAGRRLSFDAPTALSVFGITGLAVAGYNDLTHMPAIRNYLSLVLAGAPSAR